MHDASLSRAALARRALACAGLIALGAGLLMLGAAPRSAAATRAPTHAAHTTHCSSVTKHGKQMYDPTTQGQFSKQGAVCAAWVGAWVAAAERGAAPSITSPAPIAIRPAQASARRASAARDRLASCMTTPQ